MAFPSQTEVPVLNFIIQTKVKSVSISMKCMLPLLLNLLLLTTGIAQDVEAVEKRICDKLIYSKNYTLDEVKQFIEMGGDVHCECYYSNTYTYSKGQMVAQAVVFTFMPVIPIKRSRSVSYYITLMEAAVRNKDAALIDYLRAQGLSINTKNYAGQHFLTEAVRELNYFNRKEANRYSKIDFLIRHGADPSLASMRFEDHIPTIRALKKRGFNINTLDYHSFYDSETKTQQLIEMGYDVHKAELSSYQVEQLLKNKSRIRLMYKQGFDLHENRLIDIARQNENWSMVNWLLDLGINPNAADLHDRELIYFATAKKDTALVKKLIALGAHYTPEDLESDYTLLSSAAAVNSITLVRYYLELGLDPAYPSQNKQYRPIVKAFEHNNQEMIDLLVQYGASISSVVKGKYDYRYFAEQDSNHRQLKKWLSMGLKLEEMTGWYGTYVHEAIEKNNRSLFDAMWPYINDFDMIGRKNQTLFNVAVEQNNTTLALRLLKENVAIDHVDESYSKTPLRWAIRHKNDTLIDTLLSRKPVLYAKSKFGHVLYKAIYDYDKILLLKFVKYGYRPDEWQMEQLLRKADAPFIDEMIDAGFKPEIQTMTWLIKRQAYAVVKKALENGYDVNLRQNSHPYQNAYKYARSKGAPKEVLALLKPPKKKKK